MRLLLIPSTMLPEGSVFFGFTLLIPILLTNETSAIAFEYIWIRGIFFADADSGGDTACSVLKA